MGFCSFRCHGSHFFFRLCSSFFSRVFFVSSTSFSLFFVLSSSSSLFSSFCTKQQCGLARLVCLCLLMYTAHHPPPPRFFFVLVLWFTICSMSVCLSVSVCFFFKVRCPGPNPFRSEVRAWCRTRFFSGFPRGVRRRYAICWPSRATGSAWTVRRYAAGRLR